MIINKRLSLGTLVLFSFFFVSSVIANPIPVYPSPEPDLVAPSQGAEPFPLMWLILIFCINAAVDILILYSGIMILDWSHVLPEDYVLELSKTTFFIAVASISLIGISVEYMFGGWFGGLLLAAGLIWISFLVAVRFILSLSVLNGIRIASYALMINLFVWMVFYSF